MLYVEIFLIVSFLFLLILGVSIWKRKRKLKTRLNQLEQINDPYDFEIFVERVLKDLGYRVTRTRKSRDFGADILVNMGRKKAVVQVKFWKNKLGEEVLKEVIASSYVYGAREGIIITNSDFSQNVVDLSKKLSRKGHLDRIVLIDGERLRRMIGGRRFF